MKNFIQITGIIITMVVGLTSTAHLQKNDSTASHPHQANITTKKYWSIETSVVWPIYPGIYKLNFVREVWAKKGFSGEVGLGLNIQPERGSATEGSFSEEFITVFYRQYFWKGLNIQIENNFAYGRIHNWPSDGKTYESYAIFHDFTAGYRFVLLRKHKVALTLLPQAGGGFTSYVNSTWPRAEKPYWLVNLLVGIHF